MSRFLLVLSLLGVFWGSLSPVYAIEIGSSQWQQDFGVSIGRDDIKPDKTLATDHQDTVSGWMDLAVSWEIENGVVQNEDLVWEKLGDIKWVLYQIGEKNLTDGTTRSLTRKNYVALGVNEVYMSYGTQPILWGVARGTNPTRYFLQSSLADKQSTPWIPLEGVRRAFVVEFPVKQVTFESVMRYPKRNGTTQRSFENATRLKTFVWDTDLSVSFFHTRDEQKVGGDFERIMEGDFNLYGEYAGSQGSEDYQFVGGVSKDIPYFTRSTVGLEHEQKRSSGKREQMLSTHLFLTPTEEISLFSSVSYDRGNDAMEYIIRGGYAVGKGELSLSGIWWDEEGANIYPVYKTSLAFFYYL